jgi:hypothetical protein
VARRVVEEPAPDLREAWPDAPDGLAEALARGMARDPAERPESAGELARQLRAGVEAEPPGDPAVAEAAGPDRADPAPASEVAMGEPESSNARSDPTVHGVGSGLAFEHRASEGDRPAPEPAPFSAGLEPADARPRRPDPPPPARHGPARAIALVALLVVLGAGGAVFATQSGGPGPSPEATTTPSSEAPRERTGTGEATTTAPVEPDAPAAAEVDPSTPEGAARGLYVLAAADDFEGAWALAGPGFRSQLGGFSSFRSSLGTLESIEFTRLDAVEESEDAATVAIATRATHTNRVDACSGTLAMTRGEDGWLVERGNVSCSPAG